VRAVFTTVVTLLLTACSGQPVDDAWEGGPFFVMSGPLDPDAKLSGDRTASAVAWVWTDGERARGRVDEAEFEPRLYQYALTVEHPPETGRSGSSAPAPAALAALDRPLLFGLAFLYEPTGGKVVLKVDPAVLLTWALDPTYPATDAVRAEGADVAALTSGHLLVAMSSPASVERLASTPTWDGQPCQVSEVLRGLTLYRRDEDRCGTWVALALPGERTEFQGITMRTP
jgi:hypothetical protein